MHEENEKLRNLKWAFLGGKPEGIQTLRALSDTVGPPSFVCAPTGMPSQDLDDLTNACTELDIGLHERERMAAMLGDVDIALTQRFDLMEKSAFQAPRLGVVNLHPSLLPLYRGVHPISWALIRGEHQTGVTLHVIDEGIDTGPILLQSTVQIDNEDDIWSLTAKCADAATGIAIQLFSEVFEHGELPKGKIQTGAGFYARRRTEEDSWFDPRSSTPMDIFNLCRALAPPLPPARFEAPGYGVVHILECKRPEIPGETDASSLDIASGWTKLVLDKGTVIIRSNVALPETLDIRSAG